MEMAKEKNETRKESKKEIKLGMIIRGSSER
jgi:hypothetical protein